MKVLARYCVATLLLQIIFAAPHLAKTSNPYPAQVQDVSLLRPADIAYQDAAEFAQFLKAKDSGMDATLKRSLGQSGRRAAANLNAKGVAVTASRDALRKLDRGQGQWSLQSDWGFSGCIGVVVSS